MWLLLACGGPPAETATADWGAARWTQSKKYEVTLRTVPDPPEMGEFFVMEATIKRPDGELMDNAKAVYLDARMPQHNHGMMTEPKADPGVCEDDVCKHPGGIYRSAGFKFHMGGAWTVTVDVDGPIGRDSTSFVYEMK